MPDLSGIKALAQRLGPGTLDAPERDRKGDGGFVSDQQLKDACHPVTPVTRIFASQPKADFGASPLERVNEINRTASRDSAKIAHFQNLEDWKIRYLERAAVREFDANLTRTYAERAAWEDIVVEWAELHGTDRQEAETALIALGLTRLPG